VHTSLALLLPISDHKKQEAFMAIDELERSFLDLRGRVHGIRRYL
jgi:hypothetical protein